MKLYRIFILFKKDLAWCLRSRSMMALIISGVMFSSALVFLDHIIDYAIQQMPLMMQEGLMNQPFSSIKWTVLGLIVLNAMTALPLTAMQLFQEKTKGTLRALLTTPLKPGELILGKTSLMFSIVFSVSVCLVVVSAFLSDSLSNLNFYTFINMAFFSALFCCAGAIIGIHSETQMDLKHNSGTILLLVVFLPLIITNKQMASLFPIVDFFRWSNPLAHFIEVFESSISTAQMSIHTGFNFLFFCLILAFTVFYTRFYFAQDREKRFSLKLAGALGGIALLCVLSGLALFPLMKNMSYKENTALLKLREETIQKAKSSAELIPLKDFFKRPVIASLRISPDGKNLAYLKPWKNRMNIYVRQTHKPETEKQITNQKNRDIAAFTWKENSTLVYMRDFEGDENFHIFRVFADGSKNKDLTPFKETKVKIVDLLDDISDDSILIGMNRRNKTVFDVYRLNITTGKMKMIAENPGHYTGWMTDHAGKLRIAVSQNGPNTSIYWRETEDGKFTEIKKTGLKDTYDPLMFDFDNKNLIVSSNIGRDKQAIELFDPVKNSPVSVLFSHPEVDVSSLSYSKKRKVLTSASYITWKAKHHFFDPEQEKIYKDLQSKIPGKEISISSINREEDLMVVTSYSDQNPGDYWLYSVKTGKLKFIASRQPWIKESDMAQMKPIRYKSRDGWDINGYLTLPKASSGKNLPLVVLPHGGPWMRDVWGYNSAVQFLANRGFAVFQMNFRGSTGYGKKFFVASFKQWGRKMQDDISDGVLHLIDRGIADKNRVAIYGASYGGYAVLAGMTFTPELYACGVNVVGISNLFTFFKSFPPYWKPLLEADYEMIGHPEKDKELLRAISPLFHIDRIRAPLFVVHGARDPRVKKQEADQIVQALEKKGIEVPYLLKANEGHGFVLQENMLEFYALLETFLKKCLQ